MFCFRCVHTTRDFCVCCFTSMNCLFQRCIHSKELLWLLFYIYAAVDGVCTTGIAKKLIKDQLKTLERSVNIVVDDGSCCNQRMLYIRLLLYRNLQQSTAYNNLCPMLVSTLSDLLDRLNQISF